MANPYAQYGSPNPYAIYTAPAATGAKPATGYALAGTPAAAAAQTYIPGSEADPDVIARKARITKGIETAADMQMVGVRTSAEMAATRARIALEEESRRRGGAPPAGYRFKPDGTLEPIPGGPIAATKNKSGGPLDAIVGQINDVSRQFSSGAGSTHGIAGLLDYLPTQANTAFDAAAAGLEDQAAMAFRVPGSGTVSDADAARIARANKPDRFSTDAANFQRLKQLRGRVDAARASAGLAPAEWDETVPGVQGSANADHDALAAAPRSSGGVQPPASGQVSGGGINPVPGGPQDGYSVATGSFRTVDDPETAALIDRGIRANLSADQINAMLPSGNTRVSQQDVAKARDFLSRNPNYKGSFGSATKNENNSLLAQVAGSPIGTFVGQGADAASLGLSDEAGAAIEALALGRPFGQTMDRLNAAKQAQAAANPTAALLGATAGTIAGSLGGGAVAGRIAGRLGIRPAVPALAADAAYGAAYGAGENNDNRLMGAAIGGAAGAAGSGIGSGVTRMFGRGLRGVQNADVQALRAAGVPLTAGQAAGGALKGVEDRLTGIPGLGDVVRNRRLEGFEGFNRAAFNEGLAPIGATTNGLIREPGIDAARVARSQAYDNALSPVSLTPDAQFDTDIAAATNAGSRLPKDMADRAAFNIDRAGENVGQTGQLDGRGLQQAMRRFRRTSNENASLPNGYDLGEVMNQAEGAYTGLVSRQSPSTLPALERANAANRNVEILRDAVNRGRVGTRVGEPGIFAPSQLADAAAANAKKFGNSAGTTNQPFFELTRAGQRILPSSVPDSGTAGRLATLALPATLVGGGGGLGYATGDFQGGAAAGLGLGALLALGGTRTGQRALTAALLDRPQLLQRLGDSFVAAAPTRGRMFGRGASIPALTLLQQ